MSVALLSPSRDAALGTTKRGTNRNRTDSRLCGPRPIVLGHRVIPPNQTVPSCVCMNQPLLLRFRGIDPVSPPRTLFALATKPRDGMSRSLQDYSGSMLTRFPRAAYPVSVDSIIKCLSCWSIWCNSIIPVKWLWLDRVCAGSYGR